MTPLFSLADLMSLTLKIASQTSVDVMIIISGASAKMMSFSKNTLRANDPS